MNDIKRIFISEKEAYDALIKLKKQHEEYFCPRIAGYCKSVCVALQTEVFIIDDSFEAEVGSDIISQIEKLLDEHGEDSLLFCASVSCIDYSITGGYQN